MVMIVSAEQILDVLIDLPDDNLICETHSRNRHVQMFLMDGSFLVYNSRSLEASTPEMSVAIQRFNFFASRSLSR